MNWKHHRFNTFMKTESQEIMQKVSIGLTGVVGSWSLQDVSTIGAILVSGATLIYMLLQSAKLLRDWYLKEKALAAGRQEEEDGIS
jgi:hypothetical protein